MNTPTVSIVMGVYNGAQFLEAALASICAQTYTDFECIVIDDGSTDDTPSILASVSATDSRFRILTNEQNVGLTASLIKGCHAAQGEYIARMDADDISAPERLAVQVAYVRQYKEVVCVGTDIILRNGREEKQVHLSKLDIETRMKRRNCFVHGSLLYRKDAYQAIGGYRASFRLAQDYDLLLRLQDRGALHIIRAPLYILVTHAGSLSQKKMLTQLRYTHLAKKQYFDMGPVRSVLDYLYTFFIVYKAGLPGLFSRR